METLERECLDSSPPSKIGWEKSSGLAIRTLYKDRAAILTNQQTPERRDIARFSSPSKRIKESYNHIYGHT
jgi:hypothetical protein